MQHARRLAKAVSNANGAAEVAAQRAQASEFLRRFGGPDNSFWKTIAKAGGIGRYSAGNEAAVIMNTLLAFAAYVQSGLAEGISPTRKAQLDVVSDLLEQSNCLLEDTKVHPAAPAVLIGATLEEFLRTWIEEEGLSWGERKSGIDTYMQVLREAGRITKQDAKDITAWAGIRNHAAHGEWNHVESREQIKLMLQGVNLFMRKYERGKADLV